MPSKGSRRITEQLFNTVTAQLKSNPATKDMYIVIAKANGISASTVKEIRRVGTWDIYVTRKAAKVARKKGESLKQLDRIVAKPENQIRATSSYKKVSLDEWNEVQNEIRQLHKRVDFLNNRIGQLTIIARPKNPLAAIWRNK
jgi:hypothetical protein